MNKLIRNTTDEQSRAFWASVKRTAEVVRTRPAWMQAGIVLNERHFETFGPRSNQAPESRRRPPKIDGE